MTELLILLGVSVAVFIVFRLIFGGLTKGRPQDWTSNDTIDDDGFNRALDRNTVTSTSGLPSLSHFFFRAKKPTQMRSGHYDATQSATRLVKGIATHNPVVIFMNGKADTTTDSTTILLRDLLRTLKVTVKDVDVPAEPDMHLGLPQGGDGADLPYLYIGGQPVGGGLQVLDMAQTGALAQRFKANGIPHDGDIAKGLIKQDNA